MINGMGVRMATEVSMASLGHSVTREANWTYIGIEQTAMALVLIKNSPSLAPQKIAPPPPSTRPHMPLHHPNSPINLEASPLSEMPISMPLDC